MLMAPLVRRSWSLRGHTPVMHQRGRCLQKVSAIAALCIPPTRDRISLYFRLHADANVNAERAFALTAPVAGRVHDTTSGVPAGTTVEMGATIVSGPA